MVGEGTVRGGIDEALIALVGLGAAAWYLRGRYARSLVPLALVVENSDDRGDDVGALMTLVVLVITWTFIYFRTRPTASLAGLEP